MTDVEIFFVIEKRKKNPRPTAPMVGEPGTFGEK
jgi:hypothetical protein